MSQRSSRAKRTPPQPASTNEPERPVQVPYLWRGYTPVASAPKLPKAPKGGTGQVTLNNSAAAWVGSSGDYRGLTITRVVSGSAAMIYKELDTVVLTRDLPEHGLRAGDLGAVVLLSPPGALQVEFVRASGQTQALVTLPTDAFRPVRDEDLIAVRTVGPPARGAA